MIELTEKDKEAIESLKQLYEDEWKVMKLRDVGDGQEDVRHIAFDCLDHDDNNVGVHAYYRISTKEWIEVYESPGENYGWRPEKEEEKIETT